MAIDLRALRAFVILSEQLHFRLAAELLHISQPALSKQIRRLEEELGGPLLVRRSQGMHLTPAGRVLLQHAQHVLGEAEAAERITRLAVKGEAGALRVGFGIAVLARGLPRLMLQFRERFPNVDLTVRNMSTTDQLQALTDRKIDVGFVRLPIPAGDIEATPIVKERLMLVLSENTPYDAKLGLAALSNAPFIIPCRADSVSFYEHVFRTCRAAGFMPKIVQETDVFFTALNLVRAGLGLSIAPSAVQLMRVPQLRFAETRIREGEWSIGIAWNRKNPQSMLAKNFIRMARKLLSSAIQWGKRLQANGHCPHQSSEVSVAALTHIARPNRRLVSDRSAVSTPAWRSTARP